jgi:hypothetical protein
MPPGCEENKGVERTAHAECPGRWRPQLSTFPVRWDIPVPSTASERRKPMDKAVARRLRSLASRVLSSHKWGPFYD